jgi:RHS repeat-associated protein
MHVDHLGSVDAVTDTAGDVVERRSYDAFGAPRNPNWGTGPLFAAPKMTRGFTGQESDDELGLVNMKGRLLDPKLGRFLSADPIIAHPGFSQSWNPFSYVLNNPLAYVDPSGFTEEAPDAESPGQQWQLGAGPQFNVPGNPLAGFHEELTLNGRRPSEDSGTAKEVGAAASSVDVDVTGNAAGEKPEPSATDSESYRTATPSDVGISAATGVGRMYVEAAKAILLRELLGFAADGYGLGLAVKEGYEDDGALGVARVLNPYTPIVEAATEGYELAVKGDVPGAAEVIAPAVIQAAVLVYTSVKAFGGVGAAAGEAGAGAASESGGIAARARQIHGVQDSIAQTQRTVAVLRTNGGDVIASGGRDLSPRQVAQLGPGEIHARLPKAHAEVTALTHAQGAGLKPISMAVTRTICPGCAAAIEASGGTVTGPTTASWP